MIPVTSWPMPSPCDVRSEIRAAWVGLCDSSVVSVTVGSPWASPRGTQPSRPLSKSVLRTVTVGGGAAGAVIRMSSTRIVYGAACWVLPTYTWVAAGSVPAGRVYVPLMVVQPELLIVVLATQLKAGLTTNRTSVVPAVPSGSRARIEKVYTTSGSSRPVGDWMPS